MRIAAIVLLAAAVASCSGAGQKTAGNDAYLTVAVKARLAGVDVDSASSVGVSVSNGTVTLTGQAHSSAERDAYVATARSVGGVKAVIDRLSINPHLYGVRERSNDAALAAKVSAAIAGQAGVNVFRVKVTAHNGAVTLDATVPSAAIAQTVVATARGVRGVKTVSSHIAVHP